MAYDVSKETGETLLTLDKNTKGDKIQVRHITVKGSDNQFVDIRNMYTLESNGEIKPTQKGVRFNAEMLLDIMKSLVPVLSQDELADLKEAIDSELSDSDEEQ